MAAAVDPFSFATAELSEEYINVFPHPDIVPKYLETVSDKTGVQLLTGLNTLSIKGPWVSLKRAHSFLKEFLASYQTAEFDQDRNEDGLCGVPSCSDDELEDHNDADDSSPVPNSDARFHDSTGELSDWIKWTAEVLPQIQRTRSKRASMYSEPKPQTNKVPEPLVLYANFQPTPDPSAKKLPTLDAIEKELKKVYYKDNHKDTESGPLPLDASGEHEGAPQSNEVSTVLSNEHKDEDFTIQHGGLSSDIITEEQVPDVIPTHNKSDENTENTGLHSPHMSETINDTNNINDTNSISDDLVQTEDPAAETPQSPSLSERLDSIQNDIIENHDSNNQSVDTIVQFDDTNQHKKELSKQCDNEKQAEVPESSASRQLTSKVEVKDQDIPAESTVKNAKKNSSSRVGSVERKIRRKGRPKKNEKYKKRKEETETAPRASNRLSRAERLAKRSKATAVVKPEVSKPCPEKKKRGRPIKTIAEIVVEKVEEKDYVCELCSYVAKKLSHLREHKRRVHITKQFKCDKCGKVFGFGKDLKRHRLTHQKAENCCDICGKMYKGVRTLAEHKKTHDTDYIKPEFPCEFCQKIFSTKYVLAYHIKSEHLGIKKTYLCPTCGKSFSQRNSYLQHANVHMGIKPYQCDICGRSFSYEKSLKEHKYMHNDDKQFECPVCQKKFRQSSGVAIHMKIHKERKDYVCSACGKGFSQKQALIRHERIHVGEKPFACALCRRTFTDSSILRRHMILIHKKDPKKWREDTENNVQRRTDFFISVVGDDEKAKKSEVVSHNHAEFEISENDAEPMETVADEEVVCDSGESGPHISAEDSFTFVPVGIGTVPSPHPLTLPTVPSRSMPQDAKLAHAPSAASTITTLTIHNHAEALSEGQKVDPEGGDASFMIDLGPALSKNSTQPMDMSAHNPPTDQLHAQSSNLLTSYVYTDPNRLPTGNFYSNDIQQGMMTSLQLSQYPGILTQSGAGYASAMVMMPDTLSSHSFPTGTISVSSASDVQVADYETLVSHSQSHPSVQQQHYSAPQQQ